MKWQIVSDTGADRLLLIFAGWGMGADAFAGLARPGYDVMVVWDFSSFFIDWSCVDRYCEICLLAWSLGVYAASQTTHAIDYKITRRVAVCGTAEPIHDRYGLPEATFYDLADNLTEASLGALRARISSPDTAQPSIGSLSDIAAELRAVADRQLLSVPSAARWDVAIVGVDDRLFPPHNQRRAWQAAGVPVEAMHSGHIPDFQAIVNRQFVDKRRMQQRFAAAISSYDDHASVQHQIIDEMLAMAHGAGLVRRLAVPPVAILEVGSGSGHLSRALARLAPEAALTLWDIAAPRPEGLSAGVRFEGCDAELRINALEPETLDVIFSASTMQWFNSPARFLGGCARALRPGGYALISTYIRGNLHQISDISGLALPLPDADRLIDMARSHFEVVDHRLYERDLDFDSAVDVLRYLRHIGADSLGADNPLRIVRRYPMMLDGRYHLTHRPIILLLRKP